MQSVDGEAGPEPGTVGGGIDLFQFLREGYLLLPPPFAPERVDELREAVDTYLQPGTGLRWWEVPPLRRLVTDPSLLDLLELLLGPSFSFHHFNIDRQQAGQPPVGWHQDYEQYPQTNRSHLMVHVFFYLNGLNGEIGDLVLLPGSHQQVVDKGALARFGTEPLPGELVVDDVPPGGVVVVHSAMWHARRAKPGGEGRPRYFMDLSFCQDGILWPSYIESYWREMLAALRESDDGAAARIPALFDDSRFFDAASAIERMRHLQGSLLADSS